MNPLAFRELSNEGQTVLVKEETVGTLDFIRATSVPAIRMAHRWYSFTCLILIRGKI
jgi:hypothetical protein